MSLALNKTKLDNLAGDIWKSAERLRGKFRGYEYQGVILPIIVIRRLECVLLAWREAKRAQVLANRSGLKDKPKELDKLLKELELNPQQSPFSNKTEWTLRKVYEEDHALLEENFRAYINGFSKNVDDIIEHFNYRATIGQMVKNNRLAPILNQYKELELGPDAISPLEMGYIYEELLRRFSEQNGEEAGDHFTPREVIRLMVELLEIPIPEKHFSIYDPASGTGGMLSVAKEHLLDRAVTAGEKERVEKLLTVHGQDLSPVTYAICQADLLIKNDKQATVMLGNSLIPHDPNGREAGDQWPEPKHRFHRMLSNPPFGVTWGGKDGYETEARKLATTRYRAGMPRSNDGALLFLQTMLAKMFPKEEGGSRIAIIFNGSPLSNGDCGSGESEIRRWILENDWLDAIVMLPDQLFYNTGIFTYIWLLRSEKPKTHRGRVMLVDARRQFEDEPKSFGNKRHRITDAHREWVEQRYRDGWKPGYSDDHVKIFINNSEQKDFAYHKVSVVFWQTDENDQPATTTEPYEKSFTAATVAKEQEFFCREPILLPAGFEISNSKSEISAPNPKAVKDESPGQARNDRRPGNAMPDLFPLAPSDGERGRGEGSTITFRARLKTAGKESTVELILKAGDNAAKKFKAAFADADEIPSVEWTHRHYIQDDEYIPYGEDIPAFLKREIAKPIIHWQDSPQLGYEILPNKYFYRYQPPTPAKELLAQFWKLEKEAEEMLKGLAQ
jgi:type I restriction enzyme M protein